MSNEFESLLANQPKPPAPTESPNATSVNPRYANLHSVSSSLSIYGTILKYAAYLCGLAGLFGAMAIGGGASILVFLGALLAGLSVYTAGILVSALGESLLAVADIATNTAITAKASGG